MACGDTAILGATAAIRVNGVAIAADAIAHETQHHPAAMPDAAWQAAARALAIRELLRQEARRLGVTGEPLRDGDGRSETTEEAAMRELIAREVQTPSATGEECRRYYERNPARFRSPDLYEAAHILFAATPADRAARSAAQSAAIEVLALVRAEPARFFALAREHSDCPSGVLGGCLGQIARGQTAPEFEQALAGLTEGAIAPAPVETRFGYHIVRLDRKVPGEALPFAAVERRIADYLEERVARRALAQYVARLASAARIEGIDLATPADLRVQ